MKQGWTVDLPRARSIRPVLFSHADDDEHNARSTDSIDADDPANVENMHHSLVLRAEHGTVAPVIVPLSYDLSSLDAPPSPAGFMEELHAIQK